MILIATELEELGFTNSAGRFQDGIGKITVPID
jgi:hypothetical protein